MLLQPISSKLSQKRPQRAVNKVMVLLLFSKKRKNCWIKTLLCMSRLKILVLASFFLWVPFNLLAYPGIYEDRIVFGQSVALTGSNQILGLNYRLGILAAFEEKNKDGGILGKKLELFPLDDAYESDLASENAERFVEENNVFTVIGGVGTPTAKRLVPILREAEIPFIGPLTGANFLRDLDYSPNVVNIRASYLDEVRVLADHFIHDLGFSRFGIIYQEDSFGQSVYTDLKQVLDRFSLPILARATFSRNSHAVHGGLFTFSKADLDAIFVIGTYTTNSEIINLSRSLGHDYTIANLSFVISDELKTRLNLSDESIFVTEVVPDPYDTTYPITTRFRQALNNPDLEKYFSNSSKPFEIKANEVSLEGYILGRFVIDVMKRLDGDFTRENFMVVALTPGTVNLDGWILDFREGTNSGSDYIRLTDFFD